MDTARKKHLADFYRNTLLDNVLPFWIKHSVDTTCGGFITALGRDGRILDTDKAIWQQARFTWLLGTLYNSVEQKQEWFDLLQHGVDFIQKYAFDTDGRMFFQVTQDGQPLRKRRYVYSEAFGAMAISEYAKATNDAQATKQANRLFLDFIHYNRTEGLIPPKINPLTRPAMGLGPNMIAINLAQVLRESTDGVHTEPVIKQSIENIVQYFMKPDLRAVMETVGPNGEILDHFDGRLLNPGHAIEAAWFILHEARLKHNDEHLIKIGTQILDWMWERGWDNEYGGLYYFRDVYHLPVQEYWHDMKFWWPHNEAIIATLLAYQLTGDTKYAKWHTQVHDWAFKHFTDEEHGEWYGYLHRDGRISVPLKGNMWKGPFHLPRMLLYCWKLLETDLQTNP